jgi:hypothetical protein
MNKDNFSFGILSLLLIIVSMAIVFLISLCTVSERYYAIGQFDAINGDVRIEILNDGKSFVLKHSYQSPDIIPSLNKVYHRELQVKKAEIQ